MYASVGCAGSSSPRERTIGLPDKAATVLSGEWQFRRDPAGRGQDERWFDRSVIFPETIHVPGSWDAQGKGIPGAITTVANADDTQPHVRTVSAYNGQAWYKRNFNCPAAWRDKVLWLNIGGVNDRATVWINGQMAGAHDGYCTGFKVDITKFVNFAHPNVCAVSVSNSPRPEGNLEGCLDFYTNWGGIYRDVWLETTNQAWIEHVGATPQLADCSVRVAVRIESKNSHVEQSRLRIVIYTSDGVKVVASAEAPIDLDGRGADVALTLKISNPQLWSPTSPHLYRMRVQLLAGKQIIDSVTDRFGMRDIRVRGKQILLNGQPIFLRGYGDDCIDGLSVSPPASKEYYLRQLRRAKSYGFNFARHHTWVPLPEHFEAADEIGMLIQEELPTGLHPVDASPFLQQLWRD